MVVDEEKVQTCAAQGPRVVSIDRPNLPTQSLMFLDTLKRIVLYFKFETNLIQYLAYINKGGVFFDVECAAKNSEAHTDIALLLLVAIGGVG